MGFGINEIKKSKQVEQRLVWVDRTFKDKIQKMKLMKELNTGKRFNYGDITRDLALNPEFDRLIQETLKGLNGLDFKLKVDRR